MVLPARTPYCVLENWYLLICAFTWPCAITGENLVTFEKWIMESGYYLESHYSLQKHWKIYWVSFFMRFKYEVAKFDGVGGRFYQVGSFPIGEVVGRS